MDKGSPNHLIFPFLPVIQLETFFCNLVIYDLNHLQAFSFAIGLLSWTKDAYFWMQDVIQKYSEGNLPWLYH